MAQVIKLPTAAPRKVKQAGAVAQREYRKANQWPGERLSRWQRDEASKRAELAGLKRSPELFAILSVLTALPLETMGRVQAAAGLLLQHAPDDEDARGGFALIGQAVAMRHAAAALAAFAKTEDR